METAKRIVAPLAAAAFAVAVTVNALANILPINGVNTGQLSDEIPNLFVPIGLTFAIWGLIYLLLLAYSGAVLAAGFKKGGLAGWTALDGLVFIANMLANSAWILAWHYRQVGLSLAIMAVILGSLIWLEERAFARPAAGAAWPERLGAWALTVPVNVYLGWIAVAAIANVTALLVTAGWDGYPLDPRVWTVVAVAAGAAVALGLVFRRRAVAAPLVVVWAYAGIVMKRLATDADYSAPVWIAALAAAVLVGGAALGAAAWRLRLARPNPGR